MQPSLLVRLATVSYRRRRWVVAGWLVLLVMLTIGSKVFGGHWMTSMTLPNTDSAQAARALTQNFPARSGDTGTAVIATPRGSSSASTTSQVRTFVSDLRRVPGVAGVDAPIAATNGSVEAIPFTFTAGGTDTRPAAGLIRDLARTERKRGLDVELSGPMFDHAKLGNQEIVGIAVAVLVLLVALGSVVAMGLPIITALVGVGIGMAGVQLWARIVPTPDFASNIASMIGIGVGIDYALFIVTRFRQALTRHDPEGAVIEAISTAGRAVLFAGSVVVISLLGMILMRLDFVTGLAVGCSTAVALAVAAAVTLLPALLGFAGSKVNRLSVRPRHDTVNRETRWHRWSRLVQRRPAVAGIAGLLVLIVLALPAIGMRLGFSDAGNDPAGQTTRRAYDLVAQGFGPGANGPLVLVAQTDRSDGLVRLADLVSTLRREPGVAAVLPPVANRTDTSAIVEVLPTTAPQAASTASLVHHVRDVIRGYAGPGLTIHLGGPTAAGIDYSTVISKRLPIFIGAVLVLSFLLLMAVFRSILVPLKAVIMNVLSIGSAYGVMVAIFQWGWAKNLVGVGHGGPIEPWAPMMLFAIVFGLSMDYEVFLLSRIREEYDRTGHNSSAVVGGLAGTAPVITAAAAIMISVFVSFALGDIRDIKLMGIGLAAAVFVDAVIVRCLLVPATMELLGDWNWYLPRWLEWLPRISHQPTATHTPVEVPVLGTPAPDVLVGVSSRSAL
jgi:RND superfamily putative drug exporter